MTFNVKAIQYENVTSAGLARRPQLWHSEELPRIPHLANDGSFQTVGGFQNIFV